MSIRRTDRTAACATAMTFGPGPNESSSAVLAALLGGSLLLLASLPGLGARTRSVSRFF